MYQPIELENLTKNIFLHQTVVFKISKTSIIGRGNLNLIKNRFGENEICREEDYHSWNFN